MHMCVFYPYLEENSSDEGGAHQKQNCEFTKCPLFSAYVHVYEKLHTHKTNMSLSRLIHSVLSNACLLMIKLEHTRALSQLEETSGLMLL